MILLYSKKTTLMHWDTSQALKKPRAFVEPGHPSQIPLCGCAIERTQTRQKSLCKRVQHPSAITFNTICMKIRLPRRRLSYISKSFLDLCQNHLSVIYLAPGDSNYILKKYIELIGVTLINKII